jgi:hypothetical protein
MFGILFFALYDTLKFQAKKEDISENDFIDELKDTLSMVVADSWDKSSGLVNYHPPLFRDSTRVTVTDEMIYIGSHGFDMSYNKQTEKYTLSLHMGTSDNLVNNISQALKSNFKDVSRNDGMWIKCFDFSNKTSPVRYYENNFMIYQ